MAMVMDVLVVVTVLVKVGVATMMVKVVVAEVMEMVEMVAGTVLVGGSEGNGWW